MGPKLEDFEVLSTIGNGSHGIVRKVRHRSDGQVLVWKELNYGAMSEAEKEGLVLEVNLLRGLHHPNIVRFFHYIVNRRTTTLYILMEYCSGGDLKVLIDKCKATKTFLPEVFIWKVIKQICEALKVCHNQAMTPSRGQVILHRDIKPANVFLGSSSQVKLGDFGLSRTLNSDTSFATTVVGTPYYMSPEVIEGQEYNEKSDMWSLGCLVYELCALHPPFQAKTHTHLATKIKQAKYEPIPLQYTKELQDIISQLLTYQHFLRPTALMLLHHSSLIKHFPLSSPSPLSQHLPLHISEGKAEEDFGERYIGCEKEKDEKEDGLEVNEKKEEERGRNEEEEKEEEEERKIEIENKQDEKKIKVSKSDFTQPPQATPTDEIQQETTPVEPHLTSTYTVNCTTPNPQGGGWEGCACGGISNAVWQERLVSMRESELIIRERELAVREREREAERREIEVRERERRVIAMEKEARQHLIRAQIFLKQSRPKQSSSDLDSSVSGELSPQKVTTARPDPALLHNPFLEMRGQKSKRVVFKSNTLDNPKSRKKTSVFHLEKDEEKVEKVSKPFLLVKDMTQQPIAAHEKVKMLSSVAIEEGNSAKIILDENKHVIDKKLAEIKSRKVTPPTKVKSKLNSNVPATLSENQSQGKLEIRSKKTSLFSKPPPIKIRSSSRSSCDHNKDKENQVPPGVKEQSQRSRSIKSQMLQFYNMV